MLLAHSVVRLVTGLKLIGCCPPIELVVEGVRSLIAHGIRSTRMKRTIPSTVIHCS